MSLNDAQKRKSASPIVMLCDPGFPAEIALPAREEQKNWLETEGISVVRADELAAALESMSGQGCLVNLHAPYFPKSAWTAICDFLHQGGSLVSVGGAPFKRPVRHEHDAWVAESEQTAYHQELYIHETLRVSGDNVASLQPSTSIPLLEGRQGLFPVAPTWNLVPHTTKSSDLPHQMGSAGPMSTQIYPLLTGISTDGRSVSAPVVLWENSRGTFAGSRWLFVHAPLTDLFWQKDGVEEIARWAKFCAKGVTELSLKPNYASYEPGERAILTLQGQILQHRAPSSVGMDTVETWTFKLAVERADPENGQAEQVWHHQLELALTGEQRFARIPLPFEIRNGLYRIACQASGPDGETRMLRQGFWGQDAEWLAAGELLTRGRDYFLQGGRPLPVVGMTYMASDVARKFLFLPNAEVWDRDMAHMAKAGINWIRTGIWTAYRNMMQVDGHMSEEVLRSIDAFLLTAKRHRLRVTFTFFSFTPETWEGTNPYLDPQSVEAQKRFIRSIVGRYTHATHVDWDLINEPSMFDPARIFSSGPRTSRDRYEQQAFVQWLRERHGKIESLQEAWNMSPAQLPHFEAARIPEAEEINFDVQDMHQAKKGTRWLDYCLFSMEMHNRWARELVQTIKDLVPDHLVTVGQDEALGAQRPSPFFYESEVDYTTVHSWWLNDDLVWDGIFAKTPHKPNLIQETGIMYVETPDGRAKRTEEELRSILERKYAYAFSTGGAGAVQWIWNTNFYMDNANESHIGALRADGTEKPEADVSYDFGRFMGGIRDLFRERELEDIAVVFPYSNDFSNRALAYDATTKLTRVLAYQLKQPFRAMYEYQLAHLEEQPPKLIIVPSPHNMDSGALERLLSFTEKAGATLLFTGPLGLDAYWKKTDRADLLVGEREQRNVQREEMLDIDGTSYALAYGRRRIAEVCKEVLVNGNGHNQADGSKAKIDSITKVTLGQGKLIWCPLPLELNEREEPLAAMYRYAMHSAGIDSDMEWLNGGELAGVYGRKLTFAEGSLYVFVSEYGRDAEVCVRDARTGATYSFVLESNRSVLFAADASGQLQAVYRPEEVEITQLDAEVKQTT